MTGLQIPGISGLRYLAGGGFADVYRGVQTAFGREVAVKVIRGGAADDAVRRRFERECRILGSLSNHPNIVTVHDLGYLPTGEPYLVMPFLPGGTVQDRLGREGRIPVAEAAAICAKVARALQVAHDRGVVHCDVKPANVMVTEFGEPQIGDFGISRLASESSATAVAFTPNYAAPEVLRSAEPEPRRDVYALGAMLSALITGRAPFSRSGNDDLVSVMMRITEEPPPDLAPYGVPDPIRHVVLQAMAKTPEARYPSAVAFAAALETAARGGGGPDIGALSTLNLGAPATMAVPSSPTADPGGPSSNPHAAVTGGVAAALGPAGTANPAARGAPGSTDAGGVAAAWPGALTSVDPPPTLASPVTTTATTLPSRRSRAPWIAAALAVGLAAGGGALFAAGVFDGDTVASADTVVTATTSATDTTTGETEATTASITVSSGVGAVLVATVVNTCGADGGGDCFVTLRRGPTSESVDVGRLNEGAPVRVACQIVGEPVASSALGGTTDLWTRTIDGAFVSSAYVAAEGLDPYAQTLASCLDGTIPSDTIAPIESVSTTPPATAAPTTLSTVPPTPAPTAPPTPATSPPTAPPAAPLTAPPTAPPSTAAPVDDETVAGDLRPRGPEEVVRAYYEAVRTGEYALAWKLGGKNLGRSFESFVEGYANTTAQALEVNSVRGNTVGVTIVAEERTATGTRISTYRGTYVVVNGTIRSGRLRKV